MPSGHHAFVTWPAQSTTQEENVETVLTELEVALGHGFANPDLLVCALTHRSLANQQNQEGRPRRHRQRPATTKGWNFLEMQF